jgi:hypothetical protein
MCATARRPTPSLLLALLLPAAACAGAPPVPADPPSAASPGPAAEERPVYAIADAGWKKASELLPGCVSRAVVPPPGLQRIPEVTVKFAVAPDGTIDRFEDVTAPPTSEPIAAAVRRAVWRCEYVPGRAPDGTLAYTWLILTVRSPPAR